MTVGTQAADWAPSLTVTDLSGWSVSAAPCIIRPGITFGLEINRHNQNRGCFMALFLAHKPEKCNNGVCLLRAQLWV